MYFDLLDGSNVLSLTKVMFGDVRGSHKQNFEIFDVDGKNQLHLVFFFSDPLLKHVPVRDDKTALVT